MTGPRIAAVVVALVAFPFAVAWARTVTEWGPVAAAVAACAAVAWGLMARD